MNASDLIRLHEQQIRSLRAQGLGRVRIARALESSGIEAEPYVVQLALDRLGLRTPSPEPVRIGEEPPPPAAQDEPIEDWIARRVEVSKRKIAKHQRSKRVLTFPAEPIGLAVLGDPHLDNEGCDWARLYQDVEILRNTAGVVTSTVGDVHDNWIGRLGRLYSCSSATASEGWRASQWLLEELQWLAIVGGNHDAWSHGPGVDPLRLLSDKFGVRCYDPDELRLTLQWRDRPDLEPIIWVLRHDFKGRSWFHATHGPHKEAMLDGEAHILTCGHVHTWAYLQTEQRRSRITHAIRVRGYKRADSYAKTKGFYEQQHGYSCLIVIDPELEDPNRVQVFFDLERGCRFLEWRRAESLRARKGAE
jgi:hypothetical protein